MQKLKQIAAYFTIVLVLVGTVGPSVYQHYCNLFGETKYQILDLKACCSMDDCHEDDNSEATVIEPPCCSVVEISLKSDFNTIVEGGLMLKQLFPMTLSWHVRQSAESLDAQKAVAYASDHAPPHLTGRRINLIKSTFLL